MILRFSAVHLTANDNWLLEPVGHKEPIGRKTTLKLDGKKVADVFDTIASVESPLYLAKSISKIDLKGKILKIGGKK